ncbi:MAG: CapA family protein [Hyphomicrobiaceae bacterium]
MTRRNARRAGALAVAMCSLWSAAAGAQATAQPETITIVLVGDVGYSPNNQPVSAKGVTRHGRFQPWSDTTAGIRREINGDLNFMNVETVVTDRNDLPRDTKGQSGPFNFRTHPAGLRHLVGTGFNLLSLANNHSMDYGVPGLVETLRHVAALKRLGVKAAAGIGMTREEAGRPQAVEVRGSRLAFAAIGIVTNNLARHRAGPSQPGQIAYRFDEDFDEILRRLKGTDAAYRILSIHYGTEGQVRTDRRQLADWRGKAVRAGGIDLVVGHHAHVVRGVELVGSSVVFYGLGNFLHHGTADMRGKGICRDYGLMARVHLVRQADGRLRARAVEAIPVTGTHNRPERLKPADSAARIHVLNYLAGTLGSGDGSAVGMRFTPQADGRGLFCLPGAGAEAGRIGKLCATWRPAPAIPAALRARIAAACAR